MHAEGSCSNFTFSTYCSTTSRRLGKHLPFAQRKKLTWHTPRSTTESHKTSLLAKIWSQGIHHSECSCWENHKASKYLWTEVSGAATSFRAPCPAGVMGEAQSKRGTSPFAPAVIPSHTKLTPCKKDADKSELAARMLLPFVFIYVLK